MRCRCGHVEGAPGVLELAAERRGVSLDERWTAVAAGGRHRVGNRASGCRMQRTTLAARGAGSEFLRRRTKLTLEGVGVRAVLSRDGQTLGGDGAVSSSSVVRFVEETVQKGRANKIWAPPAASERQGPDVGRGLASSASVLPLQSRVLLQ